MTEFQVGDRVSVEGVVTALWRGDYDQVQLCTEADTLIQLEPEELTFIERPRRKLRVGSVWERWGARYSVGTDKDGDQHLVSLRDGGILDIRLIGVSHPDCWREVPVEELAREAGS